MSDSELDVFEPELKSKLKRKSTSKETSRSNLTKKPKPTKKLDVLGLLSEDEEAVNHAQRAPARGKHLDSCISTRVANGSLLRRAQLDGQYYVETRVYIAEDALSTPPESCYKKALVTLKVQLDTDQPEWTCLQRFLQKAKSSLFADSKPLFYNN